MKEHTPGPWKLNTDGDTGMNDSGCILDSIGHVIITDIYGTFKNGRTTGEAEANARLIAAAPDLLAALEELVQASYDSVNGKQYAPYHVEELGRATVAIAKARGGE